MLTLAFTVIMLIYFLATKLFFRAFPERLFVLIFTISTVYYGILGPWYWTEFRDSTFLGVNWSSQFPTVVFMFVVVYLIVVSTFSIAGSKAERLYFAEHAGNLARIKPMVYLLLTVGLLASGYVYFVGGSLIGKGELVFEDSLLLIFFQLSDVLIGTLLFWAATKGVDKRWIVLASIFMLYAVMSGFRSKIVLLLGPMLLYFFFKPRKKQLRVRTVMFIAGIIVVAFFSIMTITRVKFSGLDLDMLADANLDLYLYGLFAETNAIFGLSSCLKIFGETVPFAGVEPFTDVLVQFIPRAIYPEKDLYHHLKEVAWWIGNSQESLDSGTTMPFFGEYYAAFGWGGVIVLVTIYAIVTLYLFRFIRRYAVTHNQYLMGAALIAVFVGYYYFSRGSIAQISKGLMFACGPYFYLLRAQKVGQVAAHGACRQKYKR